MCAIFLHLLFSLWFSRTAVAGMKIHSSYFSDRLEKHNLSGVWCYSELYFIITILDICFAQVFEQESVESFLLVKNARKFFVFSLFCLKILIFG